MDAVGRQLEDPNGPAAHAITAPAEHDRVDPTGQDPRQQHLALLLVEQPTKDEVHQAGRLYREFPDKTQVRRLRICESGAWGRVTVTIRGWLIAVRLGFFRDRLRRSGLLDSPWRSLTAIVLWVAAFGAEVGERSRGCSSSVSATAWR